MKVTMCINGTTATGTCSTPAGMSMPDVRLETTVNDVRCKVGSAGQSGCEGGLHSDYLGELQTILKIRITDKSSGPSGGPYTQAATVADVSIDYTVPCQAAPAGGSPTAIGATCSLVTRATAVAPGAAQSGKRANWEIDRVLVRDGGPDGLASTGANNMVFERQGIFIP